MMGPAAARPADVEQVFEENRRGTVHGHRHGIGSLDARVGRIDVPAEFVRRVPAGVISGRA